MENEKNGGVVEGRSETLLDEAFLYDNLRGQRDVDRQFMT